jgi:hypothetical protein
MAKKTTKAEKAQRVDAVMTLIMHGATRPEIIQYASELWDVVERTADDYASEARQQLEAITEPRRPYEFALMRTRLEDLYAKTYKMQDYYTSLRVLKQISELTGVEAPTKTEGDVVVRVVYGKDGSGDASDA